MSTVVIEKNIQWLKQHFQEEDFYMEENRGSNDNVFFSLDERTDNGANIRLVVAFSKDHPSVDIYCFNVARVNDPLKKEPILNYINKLNNDYRYSKFTIDDKNSITIQSSLDFTESNFDPALIVRHVFMLYRAADDEYKSFMKIIWA